MTGAVEPTPSHNDASATRRLLPHLGAAVIFTLAAVVTMRGWFLHDRIPGGDFAGYAALLQYVRDMIIEHGRVPNWSPYFGGTTWFMFPFKEYLTFPLALWLEPLLAIKVMFVLTRVAAALGMYAIFVRFFGSHTAGLLAGYAFAFGNLANHQERHLDISVSYALIAWLTFATLELLRRTRWQAAICVGILAGTLFSNNYVQGMMYPVLVMLLLALRPWESGTQSRDSFVAALRRSAPLLAMALGLSILFGVSQLMWLASDLDHHALIRDRGVERGRLFYIIQSPLLLLNRDHLLDPWIAAHAPPLLDELPDIYWSAHYLGAVLLCVCTVGWFAARRNLRLRRWFQAFGLLALCQYWLALGSRTMVWQVGRSAGWPENLDATIQWVLGAAALVALLVALGLIVTRRRGPRIEACLVVALLCLVASQSLLELISAIVPAFRGLRSPGHFFDLAPFSIAAVLGGAWVAIEGAIDKHATRQVLATAVGLALVIDYWPSASVFERGVAAAPDRKLREHVAALAGEDGSLRIGTTGGCGVRCLLIAGAAPTRFAWGWPPWHSAALWESFMLAAAPVPGARARPQSGTLTRVARIRYFLRPAGEKLRPPWKMLAHSPDFGLWQRPNVLPMAYGFRNYLLSLTGSAKLVRWDLIESALRRNIVVISGPERLADGPQELLDGAALIRASETALADESSSALAERYSEALLEGERPMASQVWLATPRPRVVVDFSRPTPDRITLEVDNGSEPAVVFVSESYHPWWVARVDAQPASVLRAQNAFIAVQAGPGQHRIELQLEPPWSVTAADMATRFSWLALIVGLPIHLILGWRRRRGVR